MVSGEGTEPERCRTMTVSRPAHSDRTVGSHRVIKSSGNTSGMPPTRVLTTLEIRIQVDAYNTYNHPHTSIKNLQWLSYHMNRRPKKCMYE